MEQVVIAGAGPNGLMLAGELKLAGVGAIVLERLPERSTVPRANGLVGQVVRMLDRRGLYERLNPGQPVPVPTPRFVFGALPLELSRLADNPLYLLQAPQVRIEQVLQERALELGVEIRRGHELAGFTQDADAVRIQIDGPDGSYELTSRFLVGADGGHSLTRKLAGIDFPGVTHDDTVSRTAHATVAAELVDPRGELSIPGYGKIPPFMHHRTERGVFVYAPFPSGPPLISTAERRVAPGDDPVTLAEVQESAERILGVELELSPPEGDGPHQLRRVEGGNSRLADRFREGRVLLVGDAAHVHSAIGGPGLNLGLQDTVNLGWKLAAELQGWAPEGLLDTYESERRPVGERVVMHTQAQSALIAPGKEVTALRQLMTELLDNPANVQHLADLMSGADIRYGGGGHPLVGRWAPDLVISEASGRSSRLAELTRSARPLLIDLTENAGFAELLAEADRIEVVAGQGAGPGQPVALLIRPDGYVAWAADADGPAEREALGDALERWFAVRVQPRPLTKATR
ncbi:2-polyprenyl-6-methoxyphenol hydroxylase-like FAD-dependent oxidoreductase [Kribbella voronezhensis]|uniref:2-polyprenyl-6-methoxyphenol hydroxylase-like FAD-dependent oxidoreductase n=1 Tax=Kribbella voronezhensis TaxID=2512212 RepID=A0A4R7TH25_9ACTN|nr:FAD-dependent monooxygenase [Kribbella voronezhensis]TDU90818.1 2-polyprenyl-6-methoxyphenol hydroxylase-like FAD-dependent oxidoreductase [Kribbella voronezhensis]